VDPTLKSTFNNHTQEREKEKKETKPLDQHEYALISGLI
jgi:hypothetical protein